MPSYQKHIQSLFSCLQCSSKNLLFQTLASKYMHLFIREQFRKHHNLQFRFIGLQFTCFREGILQSPPIHQLYDIQQSAVYFVLHLMNRWVFSWIHIWVQGFFLLLPFFFFFLMLFHACIIIFMTLVIVYDPPADLGNEHKEITQVFSDRQVYFCTAYSGKMFLSLILVLGDMGVSP